MAAGDYTGYADYLASLLPGLCVQVAAAWLRAEGGGPGANNPLNITRTGSGLDESYTSGPGQSFANYPSVEVGLQAAAWLVMHGPYGGIRSAAATHNPSVQRQAIISSPWAAGHYHEGASFPAVSGTCQVPSGGWAGGLTQSPAGAGVPTATEAVAGSSTSSATPTGQNAAQFLGLDPSTPLTPDLASQLAGRLAKLEVPNGGYGYGQAVNVYLGNLQAYMGKPLGSIPLGIDASGQLIKGQTPVGNEKAGSLDLNPFDAIASAIKDISDLLGPLLINGLLLVFLLYLAVQGAQRTLSDDPEANHTGGLLELTVAAVLGVLWYRGYFATWIEKAAAAVTVPAPEQPLPVPGADVGGGGGNRLTSTSGPVTPPPTGQSA